MSEPLDLVGERFGRLIVVARTANTPTGKTRFSCLCDCGQSTDVRSGNLRRGATISCGCWRVDMPKEAFTKHGMRRSAEYRIWGHMKTRCYNSRSKFYHRYGGRGITVCAEWLDSFDAFFRDMGLRPSTKHSIERLDGDEGYSKANCCWALPDVQAANRSSVKLIEFNGVKTTMAGWSRISGVPYLKLRRRLVDGWGIARAIEAKDAAVRSTLYQS